VPAVSTIVAETWIALILISAGVAGLRVSNPQLRRLHLEAVVGGLYIATGVMLFVYPLTGVLTLTLLLGSFC